MLVNNGAIPVYGYLETETDPLDPEKAKQVLKLEKTLTENGYATKVISIYDYYSLMYSMAVGEEAPRYPDSTQQINFLHSKITSQPSNPSENLLNREDKVLRLTIFLKDLSNVTLDQIKNTVKRFNHETEGILASVTGVSYLMWDLNQNIFSSQINSILAALAIVFLLLLISLRRFIPSLLSLLPIAITMVVLYGFLGLSGLPLNLFTATIFTVTIGVGIDYAIHFTSTWESFKQEGHNSEQATALAYNYTARPVLANAFGLAIGLSTLPFSPLKIHLYVSLLMWVSMVVSSFLSLSFLPTILRRLE